jgi:antitoxin component YwqK of YwqJK toxin-antitoxin module
MSKQTNKVSQKRKERRSEKSKNFRNSLHNVVADNFITYHSNGNVKEEGNYVDGKLEGEFREYDESGKLMVLCYFKKGVIDGMLTYWRDSDAGVLFETSMYKDGVKLYSTFFDNNSVVAGNYYYSLVDSVNLCVSCVEYKRFGDGKVVVGTTTRFPRSYSEYVL